jgi:transposase
MITIGVDAHKRMHVAVALDDAGREVGRWEGRNSINGWRELFSWARGLADDRQVGIEGAWGYGRGLAQLLVGAGEVVYEVSARWTAAQRRSARRPGKTDSLDALAVAQLVRQEAPRLPSVSPEDETALLDLLTSERQAVLAESTRLRNQIHALLVQLDPEYKTSIANLKSAAALAVLESYAASNASPMQQERAAVVRRLAQRLRLALTQLEEVAGRMRELAVPFSPLTRLCGINLLTAGMLAGIIGPGRRFATDAQLAAYAGAAPLEASSAGTVRHRLNRGGNRRFNAILYRIALTQAQHSSEARAYIARRMTEGKTRREAMRALKRYLVRAIWKLWQECWPSVDASAACAA